MDYIESIESKFFDQDLLKTEYLKRHRRHYYDQKNKGWQIEHKNYASIICNLKKIYEDNQDYAKSYCSRIKEEPDNIRSGEGTVSELFVHAYYIPLKNEALIKSIDLVKDECDLIIEELSGEKRYYEVLTIMPDLPLNQVNEVKTGKQLEASSIRQKLLRKINKQGQLCKPRKNIAVINLNDYSIAGDQSVLSSLGEGLKVDIGVETGKIKDVYYDFSKTSLFTDEGTANIFAVEWFDLFDYENRRVLQNWNYTGKWVATVKNPNGIAEKSTQTSSTPM